MYSTDFTKLAAVVMFLLSISFLMKNKYLKVSKETYQIV